MEDMEKNYYFPRKSEFFAQFEEFNEIIKKLISQKYGKEFADRVAYEIKNEFKSIYEQIPYIGGDGNPLTLDLVASAMDLAVYLVLKNHGKKLDDTGKIVYKASEELFKIHPEPADLATNPKYIPYMKMGADKSLERKYSEDWVYSFIHGNNDFDFGIDFTECGIKKLFHKFDADEFTPYLCAMDRIMSKTANAGLHRTETLAEGGNKCNFRYKKGRRTKVLNTVIEE